MTDAATEAQIDAADPHRSTWLSANAGSGKTRVLTNRVARLLLRGTDPRNILCLTYTKAAASEMQNRLFKTLGGWAMLDDGKLHRASPTVRESHGTIGPCFCFQKMRMMSETKGTVPKTWRKSHAKFGAS